MKKVLTFLKNKARILLKDTSGVVTMEYVLLCVMIAGGSMLMVITFSRAVMRQIALVSYTMTYPGDDLKELQERFRDDTENDATVANIYSESFQGNFFRTDK